MSNDALAQTEDAYLALQSTSEFQALRKKFRGFVFPMTAFFLAWYFLYVLLSIFAPDFMGQQVGKPGITVGLLFGLGQFVTTFAITIIYARWANSQLDPMAEAVAAQMTASEAPKEQLTMALTLPFAESTSVGSPALNIAIFAVVRRRHPRHRHPGLGRQEDRRAVLHRRRRLHRSPERRGHRG